MNQNMTRDELLALHTDMSERGRAIMQKKNHDYAGDQREKTDVFGNLRMCEDIGFLPTEYGIVMRKLDKLARLITFIKCGKLLVADESVIDSLIDDSNYNVLIAAWIKQKKSQIKVDISAENNTGPSIHNIIGDTDAPATPLQERTNKESLRRATEQAEKDLEQLRAVLSQIKCVELLEGAELEHSMQYQASVERMKEIKIA